MTEEFKANIFFMLVIIFIIVLFISNIDRDPDGRAERIEKELSSKAVSYWDQPRPYPSNPKIGDYLISDSRREAQDLIKLGWRVVAVGRHGYLTLEYKGEDD